MDFTEGLNCSKKQKRHENKLKKLEALAKLTGLDDIESGREKVTSQSHSSDSENDNIEPEMKRQKTADEQKLKSENQQASEKCRDMSEKEYMELKKRLKERKDILKVLPRILLKNDGLMARIDVKETEIVPLFHVDIQHFLSYVLFGPYLKPYNVPPRWCSIEKFNNVRSVTMLIVEGVSLKDYKDNTEILNTLKELLNIKVSFFSTLRYQVNIAVDLIAIPPVPVDYTELSNQLKCETGSSDQPEYKISEHCAASYLNMIRNTFPGIAEELKLVADKFDRTKLLLSLYQMVIDNYPVPVEGVLKDRYSNYKMTKLEYTKVHEKSPLFAVDCEMCITLEGSELTRFTILNEQEEVMFDTLVKPYNKIVDYATPYSGITREMLETVDTRLEHVQNFIITNLPPDAILVGHSLNFDLHALRLMHPYIIDTSVIYNTSGERMRKPKLRTLARQILGMTIQEGQKGHCSVEDSIATLRLAKLKLSQSIEFGDKVARRTKNSQEKETEKEKKVPVTEKKVYETSILDKLFDQHQKVAVIGAPTITEKYEDYVSADDRYVFFLNSEKAKHQVKYVKKCVDKCRLTVLHSVYEHNISNSKKDQTEEKQNFLRSMNKSCTKIWNILKPNDVLVVLLTGSAFSDASGACFIGVKRPPNAPKSKEL